MDIETDDTNEAVEEEEKLILDDSLTITRKPIPVVKTKRKSTRDKVETDRACCKSCKII